MEIVLNIFFCKETLALNIFPFFFLQAREKLMEENTRLRSKLELANDQISLLKSHIGVIRQNTIAFILEQMDALHMQRDTEV